MGTISSIIIGVLLVLFGAGKLSASKNPEKNKEYLAKYGKLLKVCGVLLIVIGIIQLAVPVFGSDDKGKLAQQLGGATHEGGGTLQNSKYGFSLFVPQGFQYNATEKPSYGGILSLVAVKDHGNSLKSVVTVIVKERKLLDLFNPRTEIESTVKDLKAANSAYVVDKIAADKDKGRCDYRGNIKGYDMNGIIMVFAGEKYSYQLGLISYKYQEAKPDFERIIQSFKVTSK